MMFSRPSYAIGLDIGTTSVKAVQASVRSGRLCLERVGFAEVNQEELNSDPTTAQASAVAEALERMPVSQSLLVGALPGQAVVMRYKMFPDSDPGALAAAVQAEAAQNIPYEMSDVMLDWSTLDHVTDGDKAKVKVLMVAALYDNITNRVLIADAANIQYGALSVDSLALADAAEGCDFLRVGESIALINLGAANTSIHFIKDGISNFIRDVSWGARDCVQAIAKGRRCDLKQAQRALFEASSEMSLLDAPPPLPFKDEAHAHAGVSSGSAELSAMGGNPLDPFGDELDAMGGGSPLEPSGSASELSPTGGEKTVKDMMTTPLQKLVGEIRRSFDYYEQQLYERPVDRVMLSGGIAEYPLIAETLTDELGVECEIANPLESALVVRSGSDAGVMNEQPAQFMVAVGLAARGASQL
jgi:type IV pilus assembly protein PilM